MTNNDFKEQKEVINQHMANKVASVAYLISRSWWDKWEAYIKVKEKDMNQAAIPPGPIQNQDLIKIE